MEPLKSKSKLKAKSLLSNWKFYDLGPLSSAIGKPHLALPPLIFLDYFLFELLEGLSFERV